MNITLVFKKIYNIFSDTLRNTKGALVNELYFMQTEIKLEKLEYMQFKNEVYDN